MTKENGTTKIEASSMYGKFGGGFNTDSIVKLMHGAPSDIIPTLEGLERMGHNGLATGNPMLIQNEVGDVTIVVDSDHETESMKIKQQEIKDKMKDVGIPLGQFSEVYGKDCGDGYARGYGHTQMMREMLSDPNVILAFPEFGSHLVDIDRGVDTKNAVDEFSTGFEDIMLHIDEKYGIGQFVAIDPTSYSNRLFKSSIGMLTELINIMETNDPDNVIEGVPFGAYKRTMECELVQHLADTRKNHHLYSDSTDHVKGSLRPMVIDSIAAMRPVQMPRGNANLLKSLQTMSDNMTIQDAQVNLPLSRTEKRKKQRQAAKQKKKELRGNNQ